MIQPETASSSAAARLLGAIYTGGIIIAEGLTVTVDARLGLVAYTLLMVALVYTISLNWQNAANRVLVALLFVPLVRLLTLALPLSYFSTVNQFGVLGFVLLIACLMAVTRLNLSWGAVGLIPRRPLLQLIIAATGVGIGWLEYTLLEPAAIVVADDWPALIVPAVMVFIYAGLTEELVFRGIMQHLAQAALGAAGAVILVATVFATLHLGTDFPLAVGLAFAQGVYFGTVAMVTRSITGVIVAHGIATVLSLLILPNGLL